MVFCAKCGTKLAEGAAFCAICGTVAGAAPDAGIPPIAPPIPEPAGNNQVNITETLFRPFQDSRWLQKILLGGLIALIPLLGALINQGYTWLYCRRIISRNFALPEWDDWGEMLSRGFGVFAIGLVYAIVPLIAGLALGLAGGGMTALTRSPSAAATALFGSCLVPLMVMLVLSLFCFFFYPMSLTSYAGTGNFGAAFEFGRMWDVISANFAEYLLCYLAVFVAAVLIILASSLVSFVLALIPCLGWIALIILMGSLGLVLGMMATSTFGEFYRLRSK
jgi:hypothetical protein